MDKRVLILGILILMVFSISFVSSVSLDTIIDDSNRHYEPQTTIIPPVGDYYTKSDININNTAFAINDTKRIRGGIKEVTSISTQLIQGTTTTGIINYPVSTFEITQFDAHINFGSTGRNGTAFSTTIPAGAVINYTVFGDVVNNAYPHTFNSSSMNVSTTLTTETYHHLNTPKGWVDIEGTVKTGNTDGTVQINIASKRATSLTVLTGSYIKWVRLDTYLIGGD